MLIVAAVCLNDAGNPLYVNVTPVAAFSSAAISSWARAHLQPGCAVLSDGLGNLKTMLSRAYKAYRFNRCLDLAGLVTRLLVDVCRGTAATLRVIRHAETRFESGRALRIAVVGSTSG